jgi:hypothetical protein
MPYGHEHISAPDAQAERATSIYRAWRKLSPDKRLAAVERGLSAINVRDGYPLAL